MLHLVDLALIFGAKILQTTAGPRWLISSVAKYSVPARAGKMFVATIGNPSSQANLITLNLSSGAAGSVVSCSHELAAYETKVVNMPAPQDCTTLELIAKFPVELISMHGYQLDSSWQELAADFTAYGSPGCKLQRINASVQAQAAAESSASLEFKRIADSDWLQLLSISTAGLTSIIGVGTVTGHCTYAITPSNQGNLNITQLKAGRLAIGVRTFSNINHGWAPASGATVWNV